jgi:GAF domain-containing protein
MNEALIKRLPKDELCDYFIRLHKIAMTLMDADDLMATLPIVVESAIEFMKADGGSIYLCKHAGQLDFQVCINRSFKLPFNPSAMPLNTPSIATHCFNKGESICINDVYLLGASDPYEFNIQLDNHVNYRTKSTLATPIFSKEGQPIGVLQLFNRKNFEKEIWPKDELKVLQMPAFGLADIELLKLFAELASAAICRQMKFQQKKSA